MSYPKLSKKKPPLVHVQVSLPICRNSVTFLSRWCFGWSIGERVIPSVCSQCPCQDSNECWSSASASLNVHAVRHWPNSIYYANPLYIPCTSSALNAISRPPCVTAIIGTGVSVASTASFQSSQRPNVLYSTALGHVLGNPLACQAPLSPSCLGKLLQHNISLRTIQALNAGILMPCFDTVVDAAAALQVPDIPVSPALLPNVQGATQLSITAQR